MSRIFGVVGLGSMGTRRVRDLCALGHHVVGFDLRKDRNQDAERLHGIQTVTTFDGLINAGAEAVIISTPPDTHVDYYERSLKSARPFFSEANVFTPSEDWFAVREQVAGVRGFPSATWRFDPLCSMLRESIAARDPTSIRSIAHQYGGFLPAWHPWEHYRDFYAGQWRTSAAREMIPFESELLLWIFGRIHAVCATRARRAEWVTSVDDTYFLLLEFESGVQGTLSIELHQERPFRVSRVSLAGQSFTLDLIRHELDEYSREGDVLTRHLPRGVRVGDPFNFEDVYLSEIAAFVAQLDGTKAYEKSWADDRHLSNVLWAAEESARRKEWVCIAEAEVSHDGLSWITEPEQKKIIPSSFNTAKCV